MPILQTLNGSLAVHEHGEASKPPLMLLHGVLGTFDSELLPLATRLSDHFHIVGLDFRMHGHSISRGGDFTMDGLCDDVRTMMEVYGVTAAHVFGYSLGGYVALQLERVNPGSLRSLYMHGTKFYWTESAVSTFTASLQPDLIRTKQPRWADRLKFLHAAQGEGHWTSLCVAAAEMVASLQGAFPEDALAGIAPPVCVSIGDRDELVPIDEAVALNRALPKGSLAVLPAARHPIASCDYDMLADQLLRHTRRAVNP